MIIFVHNIDKDERPVWRKIDCDYITIGDKCAVFSNIFKDMTTVRLFDQYYKRESPSLTKPTGILLNVHNKPNPNGKLSQLYFNNTIYNIADMNDFNECYKELRIFLQNEELERLLETL